MSKLNPRLQPKTPREIPRGISRPQTFAIQEDYFDIQDLNFAPPPHVTKIPKSPKRRYPLRGRRFKVLEQGSTEGRAPCHFCGRKFAPGRILTHESICVNSVSNKSKTKYDGHSVVHPITIKRNQHYQVDHESLMEQVKAAKKGKMQTVSKKIVFFFNRRIWWSNSWSILQEKIY
ncbi:MAG: hypothetical protein Ta2E_11330 [Mycoplasmoidaceae bacterium]|nr:MAG: hypothetical protein Ta2E_11330 [Mycoplasmoidaceae bacterium]